MGLPVGRDDGYAVGAGLGLDVGAALGVIDGESLGAAVGVTDGLAVGLALGAAVGTSVGAAVAHAPKAAWPAALAVAHAPAVAPSQMLLAQSSSTQHAFPCGHLLVHSGWPPQSTSVSLLDFWPSTRHAAVVGLSVGACDGLALGAGVGLADGLVVGLALGAAEGATLGLALGLSVGDVVGASVEQRPYTPSPPPGPVPPRLLQIPNEKHELPIVRKTNPRHLGLRTWDAA